MIACEPPARLGRQDLLDKDGTEARRNRGECNGKHGRPPFRALERTPKEIRHADPYIHGIIRSVIPNLEISLRCQIAHFLIVSAWRSGKSLSLLTLYPSQLPG